MVKSGECNRVEWMDALVACMELGLSVAAAGERAGLERRMRALRAAPGGSQSRRALRAPRPAARAQLSPVSRRARPYQNIPALGSIRMSLRASHW